MSSRKTTDDGPDATLLRIASRVWPTDDFHGFSHYDLLHAKGSPFLALMYSQLFWLRFIEFEGMVFLPWVIEDDEDRARVLVSLQATDRTAVEKEFNYIEVSTLFGPARRDTTAEEDRLLAGCLRSMWEAKLTADAVLEDARVDIIEPDDAHDAALTVYRFRT